MIRTLLRRCSTKDSGKSRQQLAVAKITASNKFMQVEQKYLQVESVCIGAS